MTQPEVILTPQAREDIKQIAAHIKEDSPESSTAFRQTLENIYEVLLDLPEIGTARNFHNPEMKGLRMLLVRKFSKYLIFYRSTSEGLDLSVSYTARGIFRLYFIKTTHSLRQRLRGCKPRSTIEKKSKVQNGPCRGRLRRHPKH